MVKSVLSLARGLKVLEVIAAGASSISEIRHGTGLSKATCLRMLRTLSEQGWIYRRLGDGGYRVRAHLPLRQLPVAPWERLVEQADPLLRRLQERIGWPSDIGVRHGYRMRIVETNRSLAGPAFNHRVIGLEPHMLWSAMGRAYLAYCPRQERQELIDELARSSDRKDATARSSAWVERLVRETRARGCGVRAPRYWRSSAVAEQPVSAIAVPVTAGERVIAAINMVWPEQAMDLDTAVRRYLPRLRETAADLSRAVLDVPMART